MKILSACQVAFPHSLEMLNKYKLPNLEGKAFLNMGCGVGCYCGYAFFDDAAVVVGVDESELMLRRAKSFFPECHFTSSMKEVDKHGKFDVIVISKNLTSPQELTAFIQNFFPRLNRGGVLVFEMRIPASETDEVHALLKQYFFRIVSRSSHEDGSEKLIVHINVQKQYVMLLIGSPGSGKTTMTRKFFPNQLVIGLDALIEEIVQNKKFFHQKLREMVLAHYQEKRHDILIHRLFESGGWSQLLACVLALSSGNDFVFDGYIPHHHHQAVIQFFKDADCFPITATGAIEEDLVACSVRTQKDIKKFAHFLSSRLYSHNNMK